MTRRLVSWKFQSTVYALRIHFFVPIFLLNSKSVEWMIMMKRDESWSSWMRKLIGMQLWADHSYTSKNDNQDSFAILKLTRCRIHINSEQPKTKTSDIPMNLEIHLGKNQEVSFKSHICYKSNSCPLISESREEIRREEKENKGR